MPRFTSGAASSLCLLLLTITNPSSALPNPKPQFSPPSNNPSPLFAPEAPPPTGADAYLQNSHSNNNNYNTEGYNMYEDSPTPNDLQSARPFRNTNEVQVEFTTAQNIFFTERLTLNERGYGSLQLNDVSQVHHNHDGNRITAARITRSPINFPTLECFLRVDGLERDRSLLAAWGDSSGSGLGGGYDSSNYRGGGSSSGNSGAGQDYDQGGYGGANVDYYDDEQSGARNRGDGSRGRIYVEEDGYGDRYGTGNQYDDYGGGESRVEQLALTHHYPAIPFNLEPSMYYLGSTVHCMTKEESL